MANIGTFTAEKDGYTGTRPDAQRQGQAGPQRQGRQRECSRLSPPGRWARHRRGVEENQRGRARLPVRHRRRPFVPGSGLRSPDRGRGRHARPDLVAQQAPGGVRTAVPRPLRRGNSIRMSATRL